MSLMTDVRHEHAPQRWETNRVEAFSDGVFAIAITLLVLEIKVAPSDFEHLGRALVDEWPAYLAYVTSFLTVGSVWIAHHDLFTRLRFIDPVMLRLNLLLLMAAAFLPFPTARARPVVPRVRPGRARRGGVLRRSSRSSSSCCCARGIRYADSQPDLAVTQSSDAPAPAPPAERGWRASLSALLYAAAILAGIFVFPKLAAAGYLVVAVRGVLVVGGEGRLGLRWLSAK